MDLAVEPEKVILPPDVNNPDPVTIGPPLVVCSDKVLLAPTSIVELAAPVRLSEPAELMAIAPVVIVFRVIDPEVSLTDKLP